MLGFSGLKEKSEISNIPRKNHYSLAIFLFEFDTQKQANSKRKAIFPVKLLIFLARIVRDYRKKCEISNFPWKNHYSLAIFLFAFDTQKSNRIASEKQFSRYIKVLIFLARIVRDKKKIEISNFRRKNHYSLAIFLFEFDTQNQANSEGKTIFPIKVLIFLARIFGIKEKMWNFDYSEEKSLFARYFPFWIWYAKASE